jgi:hypothetical protein
MKINQRVRKEAVLICAISALREVEAGAVDRYYDDIARDIGAGLYSEMLARAAYMHAWRTVFRRNKQEAWGMSDRWFDAESESLLRCGWSPA